MFLKIFLILFVIGAIFFDFRTTKNLAIKPDTKVVINLKKGLNPAMLIFIGLMVYVIIKGVMYKTYDTFTLALSLTLVLLIAKITYFNPKRLLINEKTLQLNIGAVPLEAITLFSVDQNARLVVQFGGVRRMSFRPKDPEDYEKILYCAETLNIGNSKEIIQAHRLAQLTANVKGVYPLIGVIKDYDWGGRKFIPEQLGYEPTLAAECWYGTHPQGIACLEIKASELKQLAKEFYAKNPEQLTLDTSSNEPYNVLLNFNLAYGQRVKTTDEEPRETLPFMFKILDVAKPLSIQLHPDLETAEKGYINENKLRVSLGDEKRVFKDDNHKPELMVALSDFYLLHGLKSKEDLLASLEGKEDLAKFKELVGSSETLADILENLYEASQEKLQEFFEAHCRKVVNKFKPLIDRQLAADDVNEEIMVEGLNSSDYLLDPDYWIAFTIEAQHIDLEEVDVGLSAFYMYNMLKLTPGQGIFQGANIPHAYLRGRNVEVMANSDNVVRGGLTSKYIAKNLFLELCDKEAIVPQILEAGQYQVPVDDFTAEWKDFEGEKTFYKVHNLTIAYIEKGHGTISYKDRKGDSRSRNVKRGQVFMLTAHQEVQFSGSMSVIFASCPDDVFEEEEEESKE